MKTKTLPILPKYPVYYEDILKQLNFIDGVPIALHSIEDNFNGIKQHIARASDEIERLRKENKELKKEVNRLKRELGFIFQD